MRVLRDQKGYIYCLNFVPLLLNPPPPPPPPTHTHQRDTYMPCLFIIVFAPLPIQHSFLFSFKWMSLLKTVPKPKTILCSLFTYKYGLSTLFLSKSSIYFVLSYLEKSLSPKRRGRKYVKGK